MIHWTFFPLSRPPPEFVKRLVGVFEACAAGIDSETHEQQTSNEVLAKLADGLVALGLRVETGKKIADKLSVPVLFGRNGTVRKSFDADAVWDEHRLVLEVEAGRAVANHQFLKDLFQACMMPGIDHLAIAVRNRYGKSRDFEKVEAFFQTLYASGRLKLPLDGVLLIGY